MDKTKQKKPEEAPVVSPLANEKTYGERVYSRVFDWGLNYWTNLLASAGFSQWVEHSSKPFKIPLLMKESASPLEVQQGLAKVIRDHDPFMKRFIRTISAENPSAAEGVIIERSMERARSLTLLVPGFFVMIPAVWLGAKIKPMFVEWLNKRHYGEEAMDDPSLQARHQAIAAEVRPTFLGTVFARLATVFAVQAVAQTIGSDHNLLNKAGEALNNKPLQQIGINKVTKHVGEVLGQSVPAKGRAIFNRFARRHGLGYSEEQVNAEIVRLKSEAEKLGQTYTADRDAVRKGLGIYKRASEDLGRFIVADTVYTLVTALTIRPFVKMLSHIPFMSYKPKVAANSPVLDGDKVKVPANRYADAAPDSYTLETTAALDSARGEANADMPSPKVSNVRDRATLNTMPEQQLA
jgi:hypothetical protein